MKVCFYGTEMPANQTTVAAITCEYRNLTIFEIMVCVCTLYVARCCIQREWSLLCLLLSFEANRMAWRMTCRHDILPHLPTDLHT